MKKVFTATLATFLAVIILPVSFSHASRPVVDRLVSFERSVEMFFSKEKKCPQNVWATIVSNTQQSPEIRFQGFDSSEEGMKIPIVSIKSEKDPNAVIYFHLHPNFNLYPHVTYTLKANVSYSKVSDRLDLYVWVPQREQNIFGEFFRAVSGSAKWKEISCSFKVKKEVPLDSLGLQLKGKGQVQIGRIQLLESDEPLVKKNEILKWILIISLMYLIPYAISMFVIKRNINHTKLSDTEIYQTFWRYQLYSGLLGSFLFVMLLCLLGGFQFIRICAFSLPLFNLKIKMTLSILVYLLLVLGFFFFQSFLPSYYINKKIRRTTVRFSRSLRIFIFGMAFLFILQFSWMSYARILFSFNLSESVELSILIVSLIIFLICVATYAPVVSLFLYGWYKCQDSEIVERINSLVERSNVRVSRFFVLKTKDLKVANAMVWGLFKKNICITDYLMQNFSLDEIECVLAHEIGHIKKGHLWIYFFFNLLWVGFYALLYFLIDHFFMAEGWLPLARILFTMFVFMLYFVVLFGILSRRLEYQADAYVAHIAKNPQVYVSALEKLASLNWLPATFKKSDEKLVTHPSVTKRITTFKKILSNQSINKMV